MTEPVLPVDARSILEECFSVRDSIKRKANRYKVWSRSAVIALTAFSAAIPVFIGLSGTDFLTGKAIPSVLAAATAILSAIISLEKPHERWGLYRRYQRIIEGEVVRYKFNVPPYGDESRDYRLAAFLAQVQLDLHDEWSGLQPRATEVASIERSKN